MDCQPHLIHSHTKESSGNFPQYFSCTPVQLRLFNGDAKGKLSLVYKEPFLWVYKHNINISLDKKSAFLRQSTLSF